LLFYVTVFRTPFFQDWHGVFSVTSVLPRLTHRSRICNCFVYKRAAADAENPPDEIAQGPARDVVWLDVWRPLVTLTKEWTAFPLSYSFVLTLPEVTIQ